MLSGRLYQYLWAPLFDAIAHVLRWCWRWFWTSVDQNVLIIVFIERFIYLDWNWALQWRHNGHDSVSNHQPHDCLLNHLFRRRSKKTSKLRVTGLSVGNSPGTGEFPAQRASNVDNVSIWWRHHDRSMSRLWDGLVGHSVIMEIAISSKSVLLFQILTKWSLQKFSDATATVLSWHAQIIVAIWWPEI